MNLARAGILNYSMALEVTRYLKSEIDYFPWKSAFNAFDYLNNMLATTDGYDKFKVFEVYSVYNTIIILV